MLNNAVLCPCCGFVEQSESLTLCARVSSINNIGISTYLYFFTLRVLIYLLLLMLLVFSIYAIASNVVASNFYKSSRPSSVLSPETNSL